MAWASGICFVTLLANHKKRYMNTQINYLVAIKLISVKDFVNLSPLIVNFNSLF